VPGRSLNGLINSLRKMLCDKYSVYKLRLLILYGSYARGDYTEESDIDILVVADDLPKDPRDAYIKLVIPEKPEINPIGFNTETFIKKLEKAEPFILEVLEDGKIICSDQEFQTRIMEIYREKRREYIRKRDLWIRITQYPQASLNRTSTHPYG